MSTVPATGRPPKAPASAPPNEEDSHWNNVSVCVQINTRCTPRFHQDVSNSPSLLHSFPSRFSCLLSPLPPSFYVNFGLKDAQTYVTDEQEAEDRKQKVRAAIKHYSRECGKEKKKKYTVLCPLHTSRNCTSISAITRSTYASYIYAYLVVLVLLVAIP